VDVPHKLSTVATLKCSSLMPLKQTEEHCKYLFPSTLHLLFELAEAAEGNSVCLCTH